MIYLCKQKNMFKKVEDLAKRCFNVTSKSIRDRDSHKDVSDARSMIWYILHYEYGYSISKIAKEYKRTTRNIQYMIARTKLRVHRERYMRSMQLEILREIHNQQI